MTLHYTIMDPTGNITALVTDPVEQKNYTDVALTIMKDHPEVEQVGFVYGSHLDMAGLEFCGNATLSAAALIAREKNMEANKTETITIKSSGAPAPLDVELTNLSPERDFFAGRLSMPLPDSITVYPYETSGPNGTVSLPLVNFAGISHLIVSNQFITGEEAEEKIRDIASELKVSALGIILVYDKIDFDSDNQELFIKPLVFCDNPGTVCWEHGCASGTAAVGAYMAYLASISHNKKDVTVHVTQPGGFITVNASCDDFEISSLSIVGQVRFVSSEECICPFI